MRRNESPAVARAGRRGPLSSGAVGRPGDPRRSADAGWAAARGWHAPPLRPGALACSGGGDADVRCDDDDDDDCRGRSAGGGATPRRPRPKSVQMSGRFDGGCAPRRRWQRGTVNTALVCACTARPFRGAATGAGPGVAAARARGPGHGGTVTAAWAAAAHCAAVLAQSESTRGHIGARVWFDGDAGVVQYGARCRAESTLGRRSLFVSGHGSGGARRGRPPG